MTTWNSAGRPSGRLGHRRRPARRGLLFAACLCLMLPLMPPGRAEAENPGEYRIEAGDVLELSVIGLPDLRQRLTVDIDGGIQVPLVGEVPAAGLQLSELREKVRDALSTKYYRQRLPDGREAQLVLSHDEVSLQVAEYRPVYVVGDVSKPGEQPFRPGMTLLQAVALGGGYDIQHFRIANSLVEAVDLRAEHEVTWTEVARMLLQIQRLEAELAGAPAFNPRLEEVPIPAETVRDLATTETRLFDARKAEFQNQEASLQRLLEQTDTKLRTLVEQQRREDEGARADAEEAERLRELTQRGVAPTSRAVETRRSGLLSSSRALQTRVEVEQTRKEREQFSRQIEQLREERRIEILRQLQETNQRLATARSRLAAVDEKMVYTGVLRSQLIHGGRGRPELFVVRRTAEGRTRLPAREDTQLAPGDVVEVALVLDRGGLAAAGEMPTAGAPTGPATPSIAVAPPAPPSKAAGMAETAPRPSESLAERIAPPKPPAEHTATPADGTMVSEASQTEVPPRVDTLPSAQTKAEASPPVETPPLVETGALQSASTSPSSGTLEGAAPPPETAMPAAALTTPPAASAEAGAASALSGGQAPVAPGAVPATGQAGVVPRPTASSEASLMLQQVIAQGDALLSTGDVISARLFYELAASRGSAAAAAMVGKTYDPLYLSQANIRGAQADPAKAADWYRKAIEAGASDAAILLQSINERLR